jgi:hypothetical protein
MSVAFFSSLREAWEGRAAGAGPRSGGGGLLQTSACAALSVLSPSVFAACGGKSTSPSLRDREERR